MIFCKFLYLIYNYFSLGGGRGDGWWISSFIIFKSNCCHWKYVFGAAVQNHTVSIISKQLNDFYSCFKHNSSAQFKHQSSSYNIHWTKHCLTFVFLNNFVDFRSIKFNREVSVFFFLQMYNVWKIETRYSWFYAFIYFLNGAVRSFQSSFGAAYPLKGWNRICSKKKENEKYNRHFLNHRQTLRNNQSNDKS